MVADVDRIDYQSVHADEDLASDPDLAGVEAAVFSVEEMRKYAAPRRYHASFSDLDEIWIDAVKHNAAADKAGTQNAYAAPFQTSHSEGGGQQRQFAGHHPDFSPYSFEVIWRSGYQCLVVQNVIL